MPKRHGGYAAFLLIGPDLECPPERTGERPLPVAERVHMDRPKAAAEDSNGQSMGR